MQRWVVLGIVCLAASSARAGGYQPYWEGGAEEPAGPPAIRWHAGVRIGPYLPEIDEGSGQAQFAQLFKGARPMPMLDIDRIVWRGAGQIAVGFSAGYMQWFAHAHVMSDDPENPQLITTRDTNTFRLIPLALSAIYRATWLADTRGIPVIPYVRGGLAYDIWRLSSRTDHLCADHGMACARAGSSFGVQGAIGLAIRAERIDPASAVSARQSGILHAGLYAELSIAKVDGFGASDKLSVGDRTWSAGVDFEF